MENASTSSDRSRLALPRWLLAAIVVAVVGALIWFIASGTASTFFDEDAFRNRIEGWGIAGPIGFVALMWAFQPFGLPGVLFMVPASLVWSDPVAIALSWIGNMGASWIAFEVTRRFGRDWVSSRIPERLQRFDERLAAGGVWPVFVLRVLTGQIPAADWLLGISSVRRGPFLIGTGLGILPGIVLIVVWGADLLGWLGDRPWLLMLLIILAIARRVPGWRRRRAGQDNAAE